MSTRPITRRGIVDTSDVIPKFADKGGDVTLAGSVREQAYFRNVQHSRTMYLDKRMSHVRIHPHGGYHFNLSPTDG